MKVERLDLFDFKVTFDEVEFKDIKEVADFDGTAIEDIVCNLLDCGVDIMRNGLERRES